MSSGSDGGDWTAPGANPPPAGWSELQPPAAPPEGWGPPPGGPNTGWYAYAPPPPARPGIIPLRPLGVGELLDGAFTAVRRYPRATLGLSAAVMLVVTGINLAFEWYLLSGLSAPADNETLSDAAGYLARVGTFAVVSTLVSLLAALVLSGMITAVVGEAVLGRPVTPSDAWRKIRPLIWRLIGVAVLSFLIAAAVAFVCVLPGIIVLGAGSGTAAGALLVIGAIAGMLGFFYVYVSLSLSTSALVLEQQSVRGALRRSRALVKSSWWRVFGILALAYIIAAIVGGIIQLPFGLAGGGLASFGGRSSSVQFSQLAIAAVGSLVSSTLVRPFSAGVATLLYIDRRMRAEALDVALSRAATEAPPTA